MKIDNKTKDNILILTILEERMDAKLAVDFKNKMSHYINQGNHQIILNLSPVKFIDSSGLGAIVSSLKILGHKGDLLICGLQDNVVEMFKLTRMDRVFRIYSSEEESINVLS